MGQRSKAACELPSFTISPRLLGLPLVGDLAANRIVGPLFVKDIAGKTLRRIKELAEAGVSIGDRGLQ